MTQTEALKLALEALEMYREYTPEGNGVAEQAITAIKAALANEALERKAENARELGLDYEPLEAKDEPVAWISPTELLVMRGNALGGAKDWRVNVGLKPEDGDVGLYTTPPQRTWVGLTDDEWNELYDEYVPLKHYARLMEAIEAKLKEKNT